MYPDVIDFISKGPNAGGVNVMSYDLSDNPEFHECPDDADCTLDKQVDPCVFFFGMMVISFSLSCFIFIVF